VAELDLDALRRLDQALREPCPPTSHSEADALDPVLDQLPSIIAALERGAHAEPLLRGAGTYPDVNSLRLGTRWYTRAHGLERSATLRGLRTGTVSKGRRVYAFAVIETPSGSGSIEDWKLDDFVNGWWSEGSGG
jgi:hypothetical protein